jgi:tripartite-type tricarboxylate transporter receptor subunit TctC
MTKRAHWAVRTIPLLAALVLGFPADAQNYPSRPITLVSPVPPGGGTDTVARLTAAGMSKFLGQPIVIENRPGAAGTIGVAAATRGQPDGYTLVMTNNAPLTMNMYLQRDFPYDPIKALAPISLVADSVILLVVRSSLPVHSVAELVEYAKQHPGKLSYGSAGIGTAHHIAGELLKQHAGINMVHVPFHGAAPIIEALIAGTIDVGFGTPTAIDPFVATGGIRILGLAEAKRDPDYPDVPTISETVPGVVTNTWVGFLAPASTPKPIVDRLNEALVKTLKNPDVAAKMKTQGWTPIGSTPDELKNVMAEELPRWGKIIPSIGIQKQ